MASLSSDLVLVTGANGHVAQHIVDQALDDPTGPRVRGTVRSAATRDSILQHYRQHPAFNRLEIALLPELSRDSFLNIMEGVTLVTHVASPLLITPQDLVKDLLDPAIQGTVSVLEAAHFSNQAGRAAVKRVVLTSSFAACVQMEKGWWPDHQYDESSWNPITFAEASDPSRDSSRVPSQYLPFVEYCASKKLAEEAAWKFMESSKPSFDLTVIMPTYIFGPSILKLKDGRKSFSFSNGLIWRTIVEKERSAPDWPQCVDVRDVAKVHLAALNVPEAGGERIFATAQSFCFDDIYEIAEKRFAKTALPFGKASKQATPAHFSISNAKASSLFNIEWISLEKSVVDTLDQVIDC